MMARAIWTGTIGFGLVSIPVRLNNATVERDVRFRLLQAGTGRRIRYQRVTGPQEAIQAEGERSDVRPRRPGPPPDESLPPVSTADLPPTRESVQYEDVVKGYEVEPDRFVTVTQEELRSVAPERSQSIDIEDFVDLADIDPVFFDKSYYVAPQRGEGAEKPYALLLAAMHRAGKVAIARFVLRTKPYLAAIRPMEDTLVLETLFFADEVRELAEIGRLPVQASISERELATAEQLIGMLARVWEPSSYRDEYRERLLDLINRKAESETGVLAAEEEPEPERKGIPDLLAALKASVEAVKKDEAVAQSRSGRRRRRTG
jgi:DNA end-binding protein Ku